MKLEARHFGWIVWLIGFISIFTDQNIAWALSLAGAVTLWSADKKYNYPMKRAIFIVIGCGLLAFVFAVF